MTAGLFHRELGAPTEATLLGEASEAIAALLTQDVKAALNFLVSLAEAPSLGPLVNAAMSLALVRRLPSKKLAELFNAGRVTASVQVLLRRALASIQQNEKSLAEMKRSGKLWAGWRPDANYSVDLVTVISLAYQGLGERGGDELVSGLVDRARELAASDAIKSYEEARAAMAITGALLNTVPPEQAETADKVFPYRPISVLFFFF